MSQAVLGGKSGLGKFSLDFTLTLGLSGATTPYSSSEANKSVIVNRQCGGEELKYVPKFCIGGTCHVISRNAHAQWRFALVRHFGVEHLKNGWRYTLGHNRARIGNGVWTFEWLLDWWRHETQILFPDFDDTPPILYHGPELTNTDLLFTLPWLNISNLK